MRNQLSDIHKCLHGYASIGDPITNQSNTHYNPIFYKKHAHIKLVSHGTFWLSKTPNLPESTVEGTNRPRVATWVQMTFSKNVVKRKQSKTLDKIFWLLQAATGNTKNGKQDDGLSANVDYVHMTFFIVNTHLDWKNVEVARRQIHSLLSHMKEKIMDRRRYKVVLTGDLNWEDDSSMYKEMERFKWMKNTMASSRKTFPALTAVDLNSFREKELNDYIWQDKFESILSATLMDLRQNGRLMSDHRPVFAALLL